jgi:hypothetical protein
LLGAGGGAMAGLPPDFAAPVTMAVRRGGSGGSSSGKASGRRRSGWATDFRSEVAGTVPAAVTSKTARRRPGSALSRPEAGVHMRRAGRAGRGRRVRGRAARLRSCGTSWRPACARGTAARACRGVWLRRALWRAVASCLGAVYGATVCEAT